MTLCPICRNEVPKGGCIHSATEVLRSSGGTLASLLLEACKRDDEGEFADMDDMVAWVVSQRPKESDS